MQAYENILWEKGINNINGIYYGDDDVYYKEENFLDKREIFNNTNELIYNQQLEGNFINKTRLENVPRHIQSKYIDDLLKADFESQAKKSELNISFDSKLYPKYLLFRKYRFNSNIPKTSVRERSPVKNLVLIEDDDYFDKKPRDLKTLIPKNTRHPAPKKSYKISKIIVS